MLFSVSEYLLVFVLVCFLGPIFFPCGWMNHGPLLRFVGYPCALGWQRIGPIWRYKVLRLRNLTKHWPVLWLFSCFWPTLVMASCLWTGLVLNLQRHFDCWDFEQNIYLRYVGKEEEYKLGKRKENKRRKNTKLMLLLCETLGLNQVMFCIEVEFS